MRSALPKVWAELCLAPHLVCRPACAGCGARSLAPICTGCRREAQFHIGPRPRMVGGGALAVCCLGAYWDEASRPTAVASTLHHFKYGLDRASGRALRWLARTYSYSLGSAHCDLIVPVPLTRSRLRSRGFNQAAWIARGIAASLELRVEPDALARVRGHLPQTGLAGSARRRQAGAEFRARPAKVAGANVLLVDDVVTTGTTLTNCAEELLRAGAGNVTGVTLLGVAEYHATGTAHRRASRPPTARVARESQ